MKINNESVILLTLVALIAVFLISVAGLFMPVPLQVSASDPEIIVLHRYIVTTVQQIEALEKQNAIDHSKVDERVEKAMLYMDVLESQLRDARHAQEITATQLIELKQQVHKIECNQINAEQYSHLLERVDTLEAWSRDLVTWLNSRCACYCCQEKQENK